MSEHHSTIPDLSKRARGRWGEDLAAAHYRRLGHELLDRNWRSPTGELDLVLLDGSTYVFSEVKARRTDDFGPAAAAVTLAKQEQVRRLADSWLRAAGARDLEVRFDVVAIDGVRLTHYEAAF